MSGGDLQPWERNSAKAKFSTGANPLRLCSAPDDAAAYHGVEPIGDEAAEGIEQVDGEVEGDGAGGSLPTRLSPQILKELVAEAERLIDERRAIAEQLKAVRDAAKARGVNLKAFNELLKRRDMDARVRDDFDHCLAIYENVAGLSRGVIAGGDLVARAAPQASLGKAKSLTEALIWAGAVNE